MVVDDRPAGTTDHVMSAAERHLRRHLSVSDEDDSLVDTIVVLTAKDIIEGRIEPGATLDSITLANRFESSRTPVREALLALQRHGLVEIEPRRRPRVSTLTRAQVVEIYELRAELHGMIARKVAARRTDEDVLALEACLEAMREAQGAGDVDGYFWSNVELHDLSAVIAADQTLRRVTYGLGLQVLRLRHTGMAVSGRIPRSFEDHRRLVRAYRDGDVDLASALSRSLVLDALALLRDHDRI